VIFKSGDGDGHREALLSAGAFFSAGRFAATTMLARWNPGRAAAGQRGGAGEASEAGCMEFVWSLYYGGQQRERR
jgi:hypothetical protein